MCPVVTREIKVCAICGREARNMEPVRIVAEPLANPTQRGELRFEDDLCQRCWTRLMHFVERGLLPPGQKSSDDS